MTDPQNPFLPPQVATLLASRRKIEAIKLVIDSNPGLKLRAAKDAVEDFERRMRAGEVAASASPSADAPEDGLPEAARAAVHAGQTVLAIKIVRDAYGLDLRTAKQRVDGYMQGGVSAGGEDGGAIDGADAGADDLPADVVALVLTGDRIRASLLLQSQYAYSPDDSLARIARYEVSRKRRGFGDGGGRVPTVSAGDSGGKGLWLLLGLAIVAAAIVVAMMF